MATKKVKRLRAEARRILAASPCLGRSMLERCELMLAEADDLEAAAEAASEPERERLTTPPQPADRFEGVKYVVSKSGSAPFRISTRDAWMGCHAEYTAKLGHEFPPETHLFLEQGCGNVFSSEFFKDYTPWHPPVGAEVRVEKRPHLVGRIAKESGPKEPGDYYVEWRDGVDSWMSLSALRPHSFAPPEPEAPAEPEKAKFEAGELVAYYRTLFAANPKHRYGMVTLSGGHPLGSLTTDKLHRATDREVMTWVKAVLVSSSWAQELVVRLLRAHARRLAEAERPGGEAGT